MNYFQNLSWGASEPAQLNPLLNFELDAKLATLPIFQLSSETLLASIFEKNTTFRKPERSNATYDHIRGYRQIPELKTTQLSTKDHKMYLELLMLYLQGNSRLNLKMKTSKTQHLEPIIQEERQIYAEFVKNKWMINGSERCKQIKPDIQAIFDEEWTRRIKLIDQYPVYYSTERMIPLFPSDELSVEMNFMCDLFEMGNIQWISKPPDKKRFYLDPNKFKYSDFYKYSNESVSMDETAEKLAKDYNADIVISPSGIKHIINNHAPYNNTWNLPVRIKELPVTIDGKIFSKKIIFIDKALPKNYLNNVEKSYWVYKKILKPNLCKGVSKRFEYAILNTETNCSHPNKSKSDEQLEMNDVQLEMNNEQLQLNDEQLEMNDEQLQINDEHLERNDDDRDMIISTENENLLDDDSNGSLIIDIPDVDQISTTNLPKSKLTRTTIILTRSKTKRSASPISPTEIKRSKIIDTPKPSSDTTSSKVHNIEQNSSMNQNLCTSNVNDKSKKKKCRCKIKKQLKGVNFAYKLWNLKMESNRLRKTTSQEINILIRSKVHACQKVSDVNYPIILTPKLEYQLEYGAEICTKVDLCHQWISSSLLPGSKLIRVRIDPVNSEFILLEETNTSKIANELTKLYNHNPNIGWQSLYSVLADVIKSPPGEYMLSHNPRNGPFICLKRSCENSSNFSLNLNDLKIFHSKEERNYPFLSIDSSIILPNHIQQGVIPGLFKGVAKTVKKNIKLKNIKSRRTKKKKKKNKKKHAK